MGAQNLLTSCEGASANVCTPKFDASNQPEGATDAGIKTCADTLLPLSTSQVPPSIWNIHVFYQAVTKKNLLALQDNKGRPA